MQLKVCVTKKNAVRKMSRPSNSIPEELGRDAAVAASAASGLVRMRMSSEGWSPPSSEALCVRRWELYG